VLEFASSSAGHCKAFLERTLRVLFGFLCACDIPFHKTAFFRFLWIEIAFGWREEGRLAKVGVGCI
jgi:hypothetical protein